MFYALLLVTIILPLIFIIYFSYSLDKEYENFVKSLNVGDTWSVSSDYNTVYIQIIFIDKEREYVQVKMFEKYDVDIYYMPLRSLYNKLNSFNIEKIK